MILNAGGNIWFLSLLDDLDMRFLEIVFTSYRLDDLRGVLFIDRIKIELLHW